MKRQLEQLRNWGAVLLLGLTSAMLADAATSTGVSPIVTVDTRVGGIAVSGRVLNAASREPISSATVTLAGQSTSSSGAGLFSFVSVALSSGNTLAVSKSGYATHTGTVPAPAGASLVTMPDILLQPAPVGNKPVVTAIRPAVNGLFIETVPILNEYTAVVDWRGTTPQQVEFYVNGALVQTVLTSSTEATATLVNMGHLFFGSYRLGANKVSAVAVGSSGRSAEFNFDVTVIPKPSFLPGLTLLEAFSFNNPKIAFEIVVPPGELKAESDVPIPGMPIKFGFVPSVRARLEYAIATGDWDLKFGGGPRLILGPVGPFDIGVGGHATGTATFDKGIVVETVNGRFYLYLDQKIYEALVSELVPGGEVFRLLDALKYVGIDLNSIQRIKVYANVRLDADFGVDLSRLRFNPQELQIKVGPKIAYEPFGKLSVYGGGYLSGNFDLDPFGLKKISASMYIGYKLEAWFLPVLKWEGVWFNYEYNFSAANGINLASALALDNGWALIPVKTTDSATTIDRNYLCDGQERFVANENTKTSLLKGERPSPLDSFRQIGRKPVRGSVAARRPGPTRDGGFDPLAEGTNQVNLTLASNVFPGSDPAMASRNQELMLLYVTDNGSTNNLQFTDIRWTRWDGSNWSTALTIHTNTQAEFAPQVAYDGNGDAIAVWERVADPNFNQTNLAAMAAQMEIVWARWSRTNGQWSTPQALTANGYLDHAPLLCGPMTDGSVLVVWTKNDANLLMGTNGAGSQVLSAQWNPASQGWSVPQTLLADLAYRLSQSLAGTSNRAVYAWTRDLDGVLTNASDQQVFYCEWSGGVWGAAQQFTTNSLGNRNARVAVSPSGSVYLVWQQGTNLVLSANYSTNASLVRADSQTAGFADYAMTFGPSGNLVLLWQEMSQDGSDAYYAVNDPASVTWSKDARLFQDAPLERSFAPVWDNVGNLTFAYNKVEIIMTNKTVTLEGGGTITITNVPQPGRVDLCVTKRALVRDLALKAGDFGASGNNFLPGDPVTLLATVWNTGNVAMSNIVVAFWDGNPTNGGTIITNVTLSGWLEGAATNTATVLWIVAEPATNHVLYAVVNPTGLASEFDELNNQQSLSVSGTDLASSLVTYSVQTNGAMRVIAQVQNLGAPSATNSVLSIRRANASGTNASGPVLATVAVPLLEPGRLAQVALDLPPGTQPEGEGFYQLKADENGVVSDVDTNNNRTTFAVNLWVDSDGDGIPDSWMMQHFGHPTGSAGDHSRAQDDADNDGMNNLAEYLAGTDPNDSNSYLRLTRIAANAMNGIVVVWGSATNRLYTLQRSSNLATAFTNLAQHILSTPPENIYLDTTATNAANFFYRVKVE
jgi:hypothetical protein